MLSQVNQKATILIVALVVGKSLPSYESMFCLAGGIALFWTLCCQSSILSFLKRLYSPAPRGAVQPRPMPLLLRVRSRNEHDGRSAARHTHAVAGREERQSLRLATVSQ